MNTLPKDIKYHFMFFLDWKDYLNMCTLLCLPLNVHLYFNKCKQNVDIDEICCRGNKNIIKYFITINYNFSNNAILWLFQHKYNNLIKRLDIKYFDAIIQGALYCENIDILEHIVSTDKNFISTKDIRFLMKIACQQNSLTCVEFLYNNCKKFMIRDRQYMLDICRVTKCDKRIINYFESVKYKY